MENGQTLVWRGLGEQVTRSPPRGTKWVWNTANPRDEGYKTVKSQAAFMFGKGGPGSRVERSEEGSLLNSDQEFTRLTSVICCLVLARVMEHVKCDASRRPET